MRNMLDVVGDPDTLSADLPPGVSLWLVRAKVLHLEFIDRPVFITDKNGPSGMAPWVETDTIIAVNDRDEPLKAYEIRLHGRIELLPPGANVFLIGHTYPKQPNFLPRLCYSPKHNRWFAALRPVRRADVDFIIQNVKPFIGKQTSSYHRESESWFIAKVPQFTVPAPATAPTSQSTAAKLFGVVKQASQATAAAASALVGVDLLPVYKELILDLEDDAPETTAQGHYDDSDDLPPM